MDRVKIFLMLCVTLLMISTIYFATNQSGRREEGRISLPHEVIKHTTVPDDWHLPIGDQPLEVAIILSDPTIHEQEHQNTMELLNRWITWQFKDLITAKLLHIRFYWPIELERLQHTEELAAKHKYIFTTRIKTCSIDITESIFQIQLVNCAGKRAGEEGIDYIIMLDRMELFEDNTPLWAPVAIQNVDNHFAEPKWIESIRRLRVSGRGVQYKSALDPDQKYMTERYSPQYSPIWRDSNDQEFIWQYKPMIQFSPSICVHKSHIEAHKYLFSESAETMEEALLWLSHSYKYFHTHIAAPPPEYYKKVESFPWDGTGYNYSLPENLYDAVEVGQLSVMSFRSEKLLEHYKIGTCEDIERYYNQTEYNPGENTHSSKRFLSTGYIDQQLTQKVFMYRIAQGGPHLRVLNSVKNLHTILLLQESIYTPTLLAFCPDNLQYAMRFVEGAGDLRYGVQNFTCSQRAQACIDQVKSIKELHEIGMTQCDWKHSQWLFDKSTGRLLMVDLDDTQLIPNDCGQAAVHRHSPIQNFHTINTEAKGWDEDYVLEVFRSQFLRDMARGGYVSLDERNDIYRFGLLKFIHDVLDYHDVCNEYYDEIRSLLGDITSVYPPSLDIIASRLARLVQPTAK